MVRDIYIKFLAGLYAISCQAAAVDGSAVQGQMPVLPIDKGLPVRPDEGGGRMAGHKDDPAPGEIFPAVIRPLPKKVLGVVLLQLLMRIEAGQARVGQHIEGVRGPVLDGFLIRGVLQIAQDVGLRIAIQLPELPEGDLTAVLHPGGEGAQHLRGQGGNALLRDFGGQGGAKDG